MSRVLQCLADRRGDLDPVLSAGAECATASELLERAEALAAHLRALRPGAIALWLDNGLEWVVADLATIAARRVCVPLPHFFSPEQRDYALRTAGVCALLTDRPQALGPLGLDPGRAALAGRGIHVAELVAIRTPTASLPEGTAKITFTSGTTGRPRGVCLSQESLETVADSLARCFAPLQPRRHLCVLPLATLLENTAGIYAPLLLGTRCVLAPLAELGWRGGGDLDAGRLVRAVEQNRPETLILVPELLLALLKAAESGAARFDSLRFVAVGGARVSLPLLERAERAGLPVFEGYGLSECASVVTLNHPGAHRRGSVGRPLPHARVRIAAGGEVVVAGATLRGYVGEAQAEPGEHATGDLGFLDEDGFLYIRGRKRSVFITSLGRNLSPEWLETELAQTSVIAQAFVHGEARPWVSAILVPRSDQVSIEQVHKAVDEVNERLPEHARVRRWLLADAAFTPNNGLATSNGRIRRDAIRRRYEAELELLYQEVS